MFYVGQKVVCVDAKPNRWGDVGTIQEGAIYTVSGIVMLRDMVGLNLVEAPIPGELALSYPAYQGRRFRPAVERKTDTTVFQKMLTDSPVKERV